MSVSKNNPAARDNQKLVIYCPKTKQELKLVKIVPGGMYYVAPDGTKYKAYKGFYKDFPHEWVRK